MDSEVLLSYSHLLYGSGTCSQAALEVWSFITMDGEASLYVLEFLVCFGLCSSNFSSLWTVYNMRVREDVVVLVLVLKVSCFTYFDSYCMLFPPIQGPLAGWLMNEWMSLLYILLYTRIEHHSRWDSLSGRTTWHTNSTRCCNYWNCTMEESPPLIAILVSLSMLRCLWFYDFPCWSPYSYNDNNLITTATTKRNNKNIIITTTTTTTTTLRLYLFYRALFFTTSCESFVFTTLVSWLPTYFNEMYPRSKVLVVFLYLER